MVTRDDVESFLIRMDLGYEEIDEGMFLVRTHQEDFPIVVHHSPPLLLLRMKVMDLPQDGAVELSGLYRTLLEWNASEVVHGAYGIDEGRELVLNHTLQLESLDYQELQAALESLQMAAAGHLDRIRTLASVAGEEENR